MDEGVDCSLVWVFRQSASVFLSCWRNERHVAIAAVALGLLCTNGATREVGTVAVRKQVHFLMHWIILVCCSFGCIGSILEEWQWFFFFNILNVSEIVCLWGLSCLLLSEPGFTLTLLSVRAALLTVQRWVRIYAFSNSRDGKALCFRDQSAESHS